MLKPKSLTFFSSSFEVFSNLIRDSVSRVNVNMPKIDGKLEIHLEYVRSHAANAFWQQILAIFGKYMWIALTAIREAR